MKTNLSTLLKVGALTFCGAFFGVISITTLPTTLDGWKSLIMPALGAAFAAELVYLRGQISAEIAISTVSQPTQTTTSQTAVTLPSVPPVST